MWGGRAECIVLTDESGLETGVFVYYCEVGYTADVQQLGQIHSLETARTYSFVRAAFVNVHDTAFLRSFEPGGVPFVQLDGFGRLDDRSAGAHVKTEFGDSVSEAERKEVARAVGLLPVVQYQACIKRTNVLS